ncbi:botulinum neurotoxin N-terminal receptor binding domain-containing protein [Flavobacterium procerum]|uniref:botulinum neurotoxin N-terminal receptor binding domain-containing protein n=1 Tax=Flavobacterium procerum TaxID=1455569 RepID=UPI00406BC0C8
MPAKNRSGQISLIILLKNNRLIFGFKDSKREIKKIFFKNLPKKKSFYIFTRFFLTTISKKKRKS